MRQKLKDLTRKVFKAIGFVVTFIVMIKLILTLIALGKMWSEWLISYYL